MFEYVATVILLLMGLFMYKFYLQPKRKMEYYRRQFEAKGYSVQLIPFNFMGLSLLK